MFTGIIECIGTISRLQRQGTSVRVFIKPDSDDFPVAIGGSVAIDGTCLTLERWAGKEMQFSAVSETIKRTTLGSAQPGRRVNLERALLVGERLDGHFVYGHVDGIGTVKQDQEMNGSTLRTITVPNALSPFMAEKGSVAIDGISLTIAGSTTTDITIAFIPHTLAVTTIPLKRPGDSVNIECDMIARYLDRLIRNTPHSQSDASSPPSLISFMERSGF